MTTARPRRALVHTLRGLYDRMGLLLLGALAALTLGAVIQHLSRLPAHYTWLAPLETMRDVIRVRSFPLALCLTVLVARLPRVETLDWAALVRRMQTEVSAETRHRILDAAASALVLASIATQYFNLQTSITFETLDFDWRQIADQCALLLLGSFVPQWLALVDNPGRVIAQALLIAFVFAAVCYFFTVTKALLFSARDPMDQLIVDAERALFGEPIHRHVAAYATRHPALLEWSNWGYFRLFHHMLLATVLLMAMRLEQQRTELIAALSLCYFLGGPLYYILPGVGPRYFEPDLYIALRDYAPRTFNIGQAIYHNAYMVKAGEATSVYTWAYIACMPSLHMAHETIMLWYARHSRIALGASALFWLLTLVSTLALGWHYFLDDLGGVLFAIVVIAIVHRHRRCLLPAARPSVHAPNDATSAAL